MKKQMNVGVYDTYSTELTAALRAVGCDLIQADPLRRIFDESNPANPAVTHGLQRGGRIQYRLETESSEFDAKTAALAQTYTVPDRKPSADGQFPLIRPEETFDSMVNELRGKVKGTEAGILLEKVVAEYPHELMRYMKNSFHYRREQVREIAQNAQIVELVVVKKDDGHTVIHHINIPADKLQALLDA